MALNWSAKDVPGWDKIDDHDKDTLIWGMMFYGINPITEANYVTFFERHVKLTIAAGDRPTLRITDCRNAIGLGSNASTFTDAAFTKKVLARLELTARQRLDNERYRELREAELAAAEREPQPEPEPPLTYTKETNWGDHMLGRPTVYTYKLSDGRTYIRKETKNIVTGGFNSRVQLEVEGKRTASSLRDLREATKGAELKFEAEVPSQQQ